MKQTLFQRLRHWARALKQEVHALWLAARDPRTPWLATLLALITAGYALSPIDLIPDFIPVIGYLDDLILLPLGVMLSVRMIPAEVMLHCRAEAQAAASRPVSRVAAAIVILVWILAGAATAWFLLR
ncbi:hypothetical protein A8C75_10890 [Marinobacterium aestuarii]|uniref:DUF1232 domain-containing protein n=1 Tax=Marinobacterium aestuarii TaxID=1821621 RepID=A0A1A9EYM7_9GAMM|nr:hypothetical protein A8C75_10890 [Marinobacterium aestuarii]